ncbi:MAG: phosphoadenylyl-sulfate reductase [Candidatus Dormibacteria bacterium]
MHESAAPATPFALPALASQLEGEGADAVLAWAKGQFGDSMALACSFQDCVIVDLAIRHLPQLEVIFLDTQAHFPETLAYVEQVRQRYGLKLTVTEPRPEADEWPCGSSQCCQWRKVEPLRLALQGKRAWITGLKRCDAPTRAGIEVVERDEAREMVKINPLAAWSDADVEEYGRRHHLPTHPLTARGYASIGCAPTTRPVTPGADPRSGRWAGSETTECGLHT